MAGGIVSSQNSVGKPIIEPVKGAADKPRKASRKEPGKSNSFRKTQHPDIKATGYILTTVQNLIIRQINQRAYTNNASHSTPVK